MAVAARNISFTNAAPKLRETNKRLIALYCLLMGGCLTVLGQFYTFKNSHVALQQLGFVASMNEVVLQETTVSSTGVEQHPDFVNGQDKKTASNVESPAATKTPSPDKTQAVPEGQAETVPHQTASTPSEMMIEDISSVPATTKPHDQTAVFLNAFIPGKDQYIGKEWETSERVSLEIIAEQVSQMAASGRSDIHVYVTSVSPKPNVLNQTHLNDLCYNATNGSIPCTHYMHINSGGELDTLSGLYEYCQRHNTTTSPPSSPSPRVIYIHNKGSFHPSKKNTLWRRAMTAAVVHDNCLSPPNQSCGACGLQFSAPPKMFTNLFPGNFFAASCEYILQLWHPKEYKRKQESMIRQVFHWKKKGRFHFYDKDDKGWAIGSGRYVPEHWIGSHPFLQPCDLSIPENYWYWQTHSVNETADWEFSMFPRNHTPLPTQQNVEERLSTYKYLAGHLYRHLHLYNATPPLTSWMYEYYPDGDFWRALVERYGSKVVRDFVLEPTMNRTHFLEYFTRTGSLPPMDN